jgi:hypothetical protein
MGMFRLLDVGVLEEGVEETEEEGCCVCFDWNASLLVGMVTFPAPIRALVTIKACGEVSIQASGDRRRDLYGRR